jgi:hypothetical protein
MKQQKTKIDLLEACQIAHRNIMKSLHESEQDDICWKVRHRLAITLHILTEAIEQANRD